MKIAPLRARDIQGDRGMIAKRSVMLLIVLIPLGIMGLCFLAAQTMPISLNGRVCNDSSGGLWLTVTESGRKRAYPLPPGHCTDVLTQDAEAIWGKDCKTVPCQYQAWKVGAGRFNVKPDGDVSSTSILRIEGWGAGSHWHITREWPKPDLSAIDYSLIR
jgi:hypothetical protein